MRHNQPIGSLLGTAKSDTHSRVWHSVRNALRRRMWKDFRKNMVIKLWLLILVLESVLLKITDSSVTYCINFFYCFISLAVTVL